MCDDAPRISPPAFGDGPGATGGFLEIREMVRPVRWEDLFGAEAPVEVEIGCGNGRYLRRAAGERPGHVFLGVERSLSYARRAHERKAKYAVANARVLRGDAARFLSDYAPPGSIHTLHAYFPDPWPKRRHAKRRLLQPAFLETARRALRPGGLFLLKVDIWWHFEEILCRFERSRGFEVTSNGADVDSGGDLYHLTGFEQKALSRKGVVYRMEARRVD